MVATGRKEKATREARFNQAATAYNGRFMKRWPFIFIPLAIFTFLVALILLPYAGQRSGLDNRLVRGRALLDAQNYIGALETLREVPASGGNRAETHAYLGAAYFRLHLYQAAINEFETAISQGARRSDPWIGLASTYLELGDASKALEQAKRATEIQPASAEAWLTLGRAHWMLKEYAEAEAAGLKVQELDPRNRVTTELLLHVYFDRNEPEKFEAVLNRNTQPAKAVQDLAIRFFIRQGQFAKAYDLKNRFDRSALGRSVLESELALKRQPQRLDLHPALIRNLIRTDRFADAIEYAGNYRGNVSIDFELGKAYSLAGQRDLAMQHYRRASDNLVHKLSAEIAMAELTGDLQHWREAYTAERPEQDYFVLARLNDLHQTASPMIRAFIYRYAGLYENDFYNKAAEQALQVLAEDPRNIDALFTIATAYQRLGRLEDAERYTRDAAEFYPNNAEAWSRLGNIAIAKNEPNSVAEFMERALQLQPNHAGYLYNLGWMYDQTGDTARATSYYQRAIQASPLSFEAMNNLALIYGQSGQSERALPLLQRAIQTDPEAEAAYFNLANYHARRREWKPAMDNYQRVLDLNPGNAVAAVEKGRILLELGRAEEGVEMFNYALEFDSSSFEAYMLLCSAYEKMGHAKEALAAAQEAKRVRPDAPEVVAALQRLAPQEESAQ
jgi:tetratricopeptide (TPR) repeat protein